MPTPNITTHPQMVEPKTTIKFLFMLVTALTDYIANGNKHLVTARWYQ